MQPRAKMLYVFNFVSNFYIILILLSMEFQNFTQGQGTVPTINDPFPGNHGSEPVPTPPPFSSCPEVCAERLTDAMKTIMELEKKVNELNLTVATKLNSILKQSDSGSGDLTPDLSSRLSNIETYLYGNISKTTDKLSTDISSTSTTLSNQIADVKTYVDNRLSTLPIAGGSGGGGDGAEALFLNVTQRLDNLEITKVQTLIDENNVWRKNFEVVNKTFSKLKKSSYSNEVIVVG